jgi:hypothetical protein
MAAISEISHEKNGGEHTEPGKEESSGSVKLELDHPTFWVRFRQIGPVYRKGLCSLQALICVSMAKVSQAHIGE